MSLKVSHLSTNKVAPLTAPAFKACTWSRELVTSILNAAGGRTQREHFVAIGARSCRSRHHPVVIMANLLDGLKAHTTVVADTGDFESTYSSWLQQLATPLQCARA